MSLVGQPERATQNRVVNLFREELGLPGTSSPFPAKKTRHDTTRSSFGNIR